MKARLFTEAVDHEPDLSEQYQISHPSVTSFCLADGTTCESTVVSTHVLLVRNAGLRQGKLVSHKQ
jgi:hypothetical protein